jgi:hypothetical protein
MTAATDYSHSATREPQIAPYRAICRSAVVSLALALISLPLVAMAVFSAAFWFGDAVPLGSVGAIFALFAAVLGFTGLSTVKRFPTEYTGRGLARSGLIGGLLLFAMGASVSAFTYVTEVPDGYARVSFEELQPDPEHPELPISPKAIELTGQKIFIKGYIHPGVASMGRVSHFILVRDFGTCCFGGQPKPTHMIEVYVPHGTDGVAYSTRRLKIAGTFALTSQPTQSLGLAGVWYHLQVDQVR